MSKDYSYYNGENINNFEHLSRISTYNSNYYAGIGKDLLYALSDDDMTTEWFVIQDNNQPVYIGYSIATYGSPERLNFETERAS